MPPRLTVVVPVYNVERYLEACLASVAAQTFTDFEAVLVDDGSTDGSAAVAESWAARDPRFRLYRTANRGLGAARNTGFEQASPASEFLAFLDSDDTLPTQAYELLTASLDRSGSDFAAGNVRRLLGEQLLASPVHRVPFARTRIGTHISEFGPLVTDRTAWNKVYRRDFWQRHGLRYPEGMLYEDAPVSIPAHFLARGVDVLNSVVYHWRQREAGERSITQRRTDPQGLVDRVRSIDLVRAFLRESPALGAERRDHLRRYDGNALHEEIPLFLKPLPEGDETYRSVFAAEVSGLLDRIGPERLHELPAPLRVKYHLTRTGRIDELVELILRERAEGGGIPVRGLVRPRAAYPSVRGPELRMPRQVSRLGAELEVHSRLDRADWEPEGLRLDGYAFRRHLGAGGRLSSPKFLVLRPPGSRRVLIVAARTVFRPQTTARIGSALRSHDWAGFTALIRTDRLRRGGRWLTGTWRIAVALPGPDGIHHGPVDPGFVGTGAHPRVRWLDDRVRAVPSFSGGRFSLRVEPVAAVLDEVAAEGGDLLCRGRLLDDTAAVAVRVRGRGSARTVEALLETESGPEGRRFRFRLPLSAFASVRDELWSVELSAAGGRPVPAPLARDRFPLLLLPTGQPGRMLHVKATPSGYLQLCERAEQPVADRVEPGGREGELLIRGVRPPVTATELPVVRLTHTGTGERHDFPLEDEPAAPGRFRVTVRLWPQRSLAGAIPLRPGQWSLLNAEGPLLLSAGAHAALPLKVRARGVDCSVELRGYDELRVDVPSDLDMTEEGRFRQRQLRETGYPAARRQPLREAVLYDVFGGSQYADSPRAIHEELIRRQEPLEHLWVVHQRRIDLPASARAVVRGSREWHEALARSRYVVGNTHLPAWIERRDGQVVVQTWHGTPLKRIGRDFSNEHFQQTNYLADLEREVPQWSLLLSPNAFSTPILRRAFGYRGEILEAGYPRNDLLFAPDREKIAETLRRRLGVPEGKKVVLYAPTWREDQQRGNGAFRLDLRLDLARMRAALGADHVLLVRSHVHVVDRDLPDDGFVQDVTTHPEIAELYLLADVLVTDYSSTMFDFACTGRPILFYTYDLERYRDELRGFYFDFERKAPGPLLRTTEELVAAVRDADRVAARHAEAYRAFRQAFCHLDDGGAAGRAVDRMLALGRG